MNDERIAAALESIAASLVELVEWQRKMALCQQQAVEETREQMKLSAELKRNASSSQIR